MNISFIPLAEEHFSLLLKWLQIPHVREWWDRDIDWTPDLIVEKFGKYVPDHKSSDGKEPIKAYIICVDDKQVGYIQYHNVHDSPRSSEAQPLPASCAGLDFYIGEPDYLRKGIGAKTLEIFLKDYIFPEFNSVFVDPDEKNLAAIRCYEKVGFALLKPKDWYFAKYAFVPMLMYKQQVRLPLYYRVTIESSFRKHFLKGDSLWIFGSRTNMKRRGGDIDLYIETFVPALEEAMKRRSSFWGDLQGELGDQRIDIVLNIVPVEHKSPLLIYQVAKTEGIKIV